MARLSDVEDGDLEEGEIAVDEDAGLKAVPKLRTSESNWTDAAASASPYIDLHAIDSRKVAYESKKERKRRKKELKLQQQEQKQQQQLHGSQQPVPAAQLSTAHAASKPHNNHGPSAGYYDIYGPGARASSEMKLTAAGDGGESSGNAALDSIRLNEVQSLVLWVLTNSPQAILPRWVFIKNKPLVHRVVLLVAHGISAHVFRQKQAQLPTLYSLGPAATVLGLRPDVKPVQTVGALMNVHSSSDRKRRREPEDQQQQGRSKQEAHARYTWMRAGAGASPVQGAPLGGGSSGNPGGAHHVRGAPLGGGSSGTPGGAHHVQITSPAYTHQHDQQHDQHLQSPLPNQAPSPDKHPLPADRVPPARGPHPPSFYALTLPQLQANKYPLHVLDEATGRMMCPKGYVSTARDVKQHSKGQASLNGGGGGDGDVGGTSPSTSPPPPPPGSPPRDSSERQAKAQKGDAAEGTPRQQQQQQQPGTPRSTGEQHQHQQHPHQQPSSGRDAAAAGHCDAGTPAGADSGSCGDGEELIGVDCEMCVTSAGFELTRISCVDRHGRVLMDELVVPHNPITDYNTRYSGITESMLRGCKTRLEDVQARFLSLVRPHTLLVGHSLENDLIALKVVHNRVIDTALLYPHPRGPPFKSALKVLSSRFLRRTIQQGSHDSITDARTAMDLVNLKVKHGPWFGVSTESQHLNTSRLLDVLADSGCRACLVDRREVLSRYTTSTAAAVPVCSDAQAAEAVAKHAGGAPAAGTPAAAAAAAPAAAGPAGVGGRGVGYGFVWSQFNELSTFLFHRALHRQKGSTAAAGDAATAPDSSQQWQQQPSQQQAAVAAEDFSEAALNERLAHLDACVARVWQALPPNVLLIVATGQGDTAEVVRVQEQKFKRNAQQIEGLPPWTEADEDAFSTLCNREMQGICVCAVKQ